MTPPARRVEVWWPGQEERHLLARFYVAVVTYRALYLVFPFEFAYLYLVMHRPEWSVVPLMVMNATALAMQLPTGALADRWSRKACVLAGGMLSAVTFVTVPWAVRLAGGWQLLGTSVAFAFAGLGDTLMAGAEEAWVVDNLHEAGREDLVDAFFARMFAVTAVGGVVAGAIAVVLLLTLRVDQALLDALWYTTSVGLLASVVVAMGIREHRAGAAVAPGAAAALWPRMRQAVGVLVRTRPLALLSVAVVIASLSGAAADEAFPVSLLTKGFDARLLAPLSVLDDFLGVGAPLLGLALARRLGPERLLSVTMVTLGASVTVLFASRTVGVVVVLFVLLDFLDRVWDPVSLARLQEDIPSVHRAAIGSLVYQANGLAQLGGLGLFALVLGSHSRQLREATPDLLEAFRGHSHVAATVPTGLLGLPVPDAAIVVFVLVGVTAVPFVVLAARARRRAAAAPGAPTRPAAPPVAGRTPPSTPR